MRETETFVQQTYGAIARTVRQGAAAGCCGASTCGPTDPICGELYDAEETTSLPGAALNASLGCGSPTALVALQPGQTVLDLGSGGGIDVLLSARRVGPTGKVYGVDMTDDMLTLARENQAKEGLTNVEFLKGRIEAVPLPPASVDVVISNCVINLSHDKEAVFREAFRVLKPGGQFAVSDIVVRGPIPAQLRENMALWAGCVAGAVHEADYVGGLRAVGFEDVSVEPWRVYTAGDVRSVLEHGGLDAAAFAGEVEGQFMSAFVRARKPAASAASPCCSSTCCR